VNRRQLARQIAWWLDPARFTWNESPSGPVLAAVSVSQKGPEHFWGNLQTPFGLVRTLGYTPDPQHPGRLSRASFAVDVVAEGFADRAGSSALVGANRTSTGGRSGGRGVLDVAARVAERLATLDGSSGFQAVARAANGEEEANPEEGVTVALARVEVEAYGLQSAPYYHPPTRFKATAGGSGACALAWSLPVARFDRFGVVLRYSASGYPSSATDGTGLALSSVTATSLSATGLPSGLVYFALFGSYDETGAGSPNVYSEAARCTATIA